MTKNLSAAAETPRIEPSRHCGDSVRAVLDRAVFCYACGAGVDTSRRAEPRWWHVRVSKQPYRWEVFCGQCAPAAIAQADAGTEEGQMVLL